MYAGVDYTHFSDTWQERKQKIARNLVQYYVYDIITNYWSEGGTGKIHSAAKPNRYMMEIPDRAWMVALDGFFERSMLRAEKKNIANPRSEEYGAQTLKILSKSLTKEFGKGFSRSNLQNMRSFYLNYPEFLKCQSATGKLTWTHYCELLSISDTDKRSFYEKECTNSGWSVRELKRQIESSLFERLLLSKGDANKEQVLAMASKGIDYTKPEDVIKDPYVFEFLGIPEDKPMLESDLENALVRQIEKFLLELGRGFMFVGTQQRVTVGNIHRYVDMVFYNKIFKAYVLIELKTVKLMPEAVGQLKK
jgi:predicted nuclease of restriction endonuclease-like (RecB) superfamily